ncbi:MAG: hemolysin III family protein [Oscillospiraceae bacterium]|nr:hemolysin III family protein [Oscillospiraceae bacterium]
MKRIKLSDRMLPTYSKGEEIMNMVTHIAGGSLGILALILCLVRAVRVGNTAAIVGAAIYGGAMVSLYAVSSIYHGLKPGTAKKVMQVIDHCTIYFLIVGTYTPILLAAFLPVYPGIAYGLLLGEWVLCALAVTLTAIDLKKYNVFSMICYIGMGWGIIFFLPQCIEAMTPAGFYWLLSGGIAYTIGAIFYGIGSKKPWIHSVFHLFVVLGSILQFIAIYFYAL